MAPQPISYYHRYQRREKIEEIYGERWLAWTYHTPFGQLALHALVKRAFFSAWYGWRMNLRSSRAKIGPFMERYHVDPEEFAVATNRFANFNEFFFRRLKHSARPICSDVRAAVFPADGRHLGFADASTAPGLYVKGQRLDIPALLGDRALGEVFARGSLVISRLCPVDYHRFHFPADGVPGPARLINGPLFSVSPLALRRNVGYLVQNKRMVTILDSERFGRIACIEIGATCVGGIAQTFTPGERAFRGEEKGYFRFGGSCVALLFEPGRIRLADDLLEQSANQRELYARMGDRMGNVVT